MVDGGTHSRVLELLEADPWAELCSVATLRRSWEQVLARDLADDWLAPTTRRFAAAAEASLEELAEQLRTGSYEPAPLTAVRHTDPDGDVRELQIPAARDRVVERALVDVLTPIVDPLLSPQSFGYRPGLGVVDAIAALVRLREEGFAWVVRTDVADCFPSIDRALLLERLEGILGPGPLRSVVGRLLGRPVRRNGRRAMPRRGIPQGSALSPLLANVYLDAVDRGLIADGVPAVRYADDLTLAATSEQEARSALRLVERHLWRIGMSTGDDKTEVVSWEDGFCFLGEDLSSRYPTEQECSRRLEPMRRTLYVGLQGSAVWFRRGQFVVVDDDATQLEVPAGHVGRIVAAGSVGISAGARSWALRNDVDVVFLSRRGSLEGWLASGRVGDVRRRKRQYRCTDDEQFALRLAKRFVLGKLTNCRAHLMRAVRRRVEGLGGAIDEIDAYRDGLADATTLDEVRGLEGIAARRYFEVLAKLLPDDLPFAGRTRNPPGDVVNAALSYGYAVLLGETTTALVSAGLDPGAGFLHADEANRPSLALDLMEEFRPLIVDATVCELFRRGSLTASHGRVETDRAGVWLTENGRRRLLAGLEDRFLTIATHVPSGTKTSYRRSLHLQAAQIAADVDAWDVRYRPVTWR